MSSLPTNAGDPRPENFEVSDYSTRKFDYARFTNGGTFVSWGNLEFTLPTDYNIDVYYGKDIVDFHKRKNAGELLPFTRYRKITQSYFKLTGATWWRDTVNDPNHYYVWTPKDGLGGNPPFVFFAKDPFVGPFDRDVLKHSEFLDDLHSRGINPRHFVQLAAAKLYSRGWDAGTFLAELRKTVQLVHSAFSRFSKLMREFDEWFKKIKRLKPDAVASSLLQQWLEARYGWRLLLYDIRDINNFIKNFDEKQRDRNKERVGALFTFEDDLSKYFPSGIVDRYLTDTREVEINVRGRIIADFTPSRLILNPVTTGWEVVPYSFVIDWFFGIGTALEAMSFLTLNDKYTACWSYSMNVTRTSSLEAAWAPGYEGSSTQTVDQIYEVIRREPITVPLLPAWDNKLDIPKYIDILGLIDGLMRGLLRNWGIR